MKISVIFSLIIIEFIASFVATSTIHILENVIKYYRNREFIDAINVIEQKLLLKKFTTLNVISAVENQNDFVFNDLKTSLAARESIVSVRRYTNHTQISSVEDRLRNVAVVLLDNLQSFKILFKNITPDRFNFRGFYLIVLIHGKFDGIEEIFRLCWTKGIISESFDFLTLLEKTKMWKNKCNFN